jgi:uncharacterized protein YjiS (DUF1127 family)
MSAYVSNSNLTGSQSSYAPIRLDRTATRETWWSPAIFNVVGTHTLEKIHAIKIVVSEWQERRRQRAELRRLNWRELQDFCPRLAAAEEEMDKPFWQP